MSRRRRRTQAARVQAARAAFSFGDSSTGRAKFASRSPLLLPRFSALATTGLEKLTALRAVQGWVRRSGAKHLPVSVRVQRRNQQLRSLRSLIMPKVRSNPCARRRVRKEVIFSLGIGGRRWGSGGPSMSHARRTVESNYSCRR